MDPKLTKKIADAGLDKEAKSIENFQETTHVEVLKNRMVDLIKIAGLSDDIDVSVEITASINFIEKEKTKEKEEKVDPAKE